jgi:hypothetical protein
VWPLFVQLLTLLQCSGRLHALHFPCVCVHRLSFSLLVLHTPGITFCAALPVICGSRLAVKHVCVQQVLLDTLTVPQIVERLLRIFMQPEGFAPHAQVFPVTSVLTSRSRFCKIHFNVLLPTMPQTCQAVFFQRSGTLVLPCS